MMKSHQPRTVPVVDDAGGGRRGSGGGILVPWSTWLYNWPRFPGW